MGLHCFSELFGQVIQVQIFSDAHNALIMRLMQRDEQQQQQQQQQIFEHFNKCDFWSKFFSISFFKKHLIKF